jgi:hypothetical protein
MIACKYCKKGKHPECSGHILKRGCQCFCNNIVLNEEELAAAMYAYSKKIYGATSYDLAFFTGYANHVINMHKKVDPYVQYLTRIYKNANSSSDLDMIYPN